MTQTLLEVLSAFTDGDAVDPATLSEALAQSGAHAAMLEIARIRAAVRLDASVPSPGFYAAIEKELAAASSPARKGRLRLAAAAVVILGIGVAAGLALRSSVPPRAAGTPPAPTRQIQFTPGVDWFAKS